MRTARSTRVALATAILAIALSISSQLLADVVPSIPDNCPTGSSGDSLHCTGGFCSPTTCLTDASCPAGQKCQSRAFCIKRYMCTNHFMPDAGAHPVDTVSGICPNGNECMNGDFCDVTTRCVDPAALAPPASGGCDVQRGSGGMLFGALFTMALAITMLDLVLRRRRAQRHT